MKLNKIKIELKKKLKNYKNLKINFFGEKNKVNYLIIQKLNIRKKF